MRFAALITNELHSVYRHRPAPRKAITAGSVEYTPAGAGCPLAPDRSKETPPERGFSCGLMMPILLGHPNLVFNGQARKRQAADKAERPRRRFDVNGGKIGAELSPNG